MPPSASPPPAASPARGSRRRSASRSASRSAAAGSAATSWRGWTRSGNGSALAEYRDDLAAIRREALARMAAEAERLGANAVVGVRFDTAEVGREMVEVVAYGTAVETEDA